MKPQSSLATVLQFPVPDTKEEKLPRKTKTDEIDELVEGLDALEEDDEVLDIEVDDDPDEAPKKGRTRKPRAPKEPKEKVGIGTPELADELGITARSLRMFLRAKGYQPKDDREGRYVWKSLNDPEAKQIIKAFRSNEAAKANKDALAETKKPRKKAAVVEDEDDDE
jgi:hypothetical protein